MELPDPPTPTTEENVTDQSTEADDAPANQQEALLADSKEDEPEVEAKAPDAAAYFKERITETEAPTETKHNFDQGVRQNSHKLAKQGKTLSKLEATLERIEQRLEGAATSSDPEEDDILSGEDDDYLTIGQQKKLIAAQAKKLEKAKAAEPQKEAEPEPDDEPPQITYDQAIDKMTSNVREMHDNVVDTQGVDRANEIVLLSLPAIKKQLAENRGQTEQAASDYAFKEVQLQIQKLISDGVLPKTASQGKAPAKQPKTETGSRSPVNRLSLIHI